MAVLKAKLVEQKLRELHGNMAAVGRHFGVTRAAVHNYVRKRPNLLAVLDEAREAMKDHAESALHTAIFKGEAWAICFYLKTQAKSRGYVERTELRHGGDTNAPAIPIKFVEVTIGSGEPIGSEPVWRV
jgi:predicted transcriptional regulator